MISNQKNNKKRDYCHLLAVANRFLLALVLVCGVYFVVSINDLSIKGFVLQELKTEIAKLENDKKNVELSIMKLESYENINQKASDLKMVKVDKIDYVTVANGAVAMR